MRFALAACLCAFAFYKRDFIKWLLERVKRQIDSNSVMRKAIWKSCEADLRLDEVYIDVTAGEDTKKILVYPSMNEVK